jgi:hypothetical protein
MMIITTMVMTTVLCGREADSVLTKCASVSVVPPASCGCRCGCVGAHDDVNDDVNDEEAEDEDEEDDGLRDSSRATHTAHRG